MITGHRFMPLFAVALCFARPLPAFADQTEVTVMQPPGIDLATLKEVLTDPKPSIGGGVATVAALALWSAIGNILVHTEMCQNANTALGDATHHQFSVKTNVVTVGGAPAFSYSQYFLAVAGPDIIGYAPITVLPDGTTITGPIKYCGKSYTVPPSARNSPTPGPAHPRVGVHKIVYESRQGRLDLRLPDDIRAGDMISGTVLVEPKGATEAERVANAATLNGYVIDVDGRRNRVADGKMLITIPQTGVMVPLVLRDAAGNPVDLMGIAATPPDVPVRQLAVPAATQAGQPLSIPGAFDGNSANTTATINGQPVPIIAESPRQTVLDCPPGTTGPAVVTVTDPAATVTARTNLVSLALSAPRTTLLRGEKTTMTMQVSGLQGLTEPVKVTLTASTNVQLQGGNQQVVTIDAARTGASGSHVSTYQLAFQAPGPFQIDARLLPPGEAANPPAPSPAQPAKPPSRRMRGM